MQKVAREINCESCGASYDILYESTPYDENEITFCSFCGEELDEIDDEEDEDDYE